MGVRRTLVMISGGFDPLHVGHLDMIQEAGKFGNVVIALNSDEWLMRKKGYVFMPWEDRRRLLTALLGVQRVVAVQDGDGTVCEALGAIRPDYFANGGDRGKRNTPEVEMCERLGISLAWNVGGGKTRSSSGLVAASGTSRTPPHS